jgi:hypothetical protein
MMDEQRLQAIERHKYISVDTRDLIAEVRCLRLIIDLYMTNAVHLNNSHIVYDLYPNGCIRG